ncbi:hypothetical protein D3C77_731670 [compost metagenome]
MEYSFSNWGMTAAGDFPEAANSVDCGLGVIAKAASHRHQLTTFRCKSKNLTWATDLVEDLFKQHNRFQD